MENTKKGTTVYIKKDVLEHIGSNTQIKTLSEWMNVAYQEQFMTIKKEEEKIIFHRKQIEKCQERIKALKDCKISRIVNDEAFNWIKSEGIERVEHFSFDGVRNFFNNKFQYELTNKEFKILLKEVEDGNKI